VSSKQVSSKADADVPQLPTRSGQTEFPVEARETVAPQAEANAPNPVTCNLATAFALTETTHVGVGKMRTELKLRVPHDGLILVGDGQKALFLRNRGNAQRVDLVVERILEQDNPATREQGTDRPGRSTASPGVARSAMEEVDWHHLEKERFANEVAEALYRHAHANRFDSLVIIAPPKILGNLRKAFHAEVTDRIKAEIPKELTSHPVSEIEKLVAA
jgi:protein required for attachment to host cells